MRRTRAARMLALAAAIVCLGAAQPPGARRTVWTTLGTSSGPNPNPLRAQPANLLVAEGQAILIDSGDGAVDQLAKSGTPLDSVHTLFVSHLHFDHIGGLFALIGRRYQLVAPGVLTIYGPPGTTAVVDGLIAAMEPAALAGSVIRQRAGRRPADTVNVIEIGDGSRLTLGAIKVTAAANSHYAAMTDAGDAHPPVSLSYRFDTPGRSITFTGDTGPSEAVAQLAQGSDLLVSEIIDVDATLARLRSSRSDLSPPVLALVERHYRLEHLAPAEVGQLARRAGAKALVLTHDAVAPEGVAAARAAIAAFYKGPVRFAADLDRF